MNGGASHADISSEQVMNYVPVSATNTSKHRPPLVCVPLTVCTLHQGIVPNEKSPHYVTINMLILDAKYTMYNTPQKRVSACCCKETNDDHFSLDIWNSKPIRA